MRACLGPLVNHWHELLTVNHDGWMGVHHTTIVHLRCRHFNAFDRGMMHLEKAFGFVCAPHQWISRMDSNDKMIVVERWAATGSSSG